ncbi:MAG: FtsQ-type POTRA domain-containing protein [Chloroflexota bacterium]|nr:MAG: hypothetical protein KatS3mg047_0348 [Bellilinea sp.]
MSVNSTSTLNRAEQLRQRRAQKTTNRASAARKSAPLKSTASSKPAPSVLLRGYQASTSVPLRKIPPMRVRRQYYYPLGSSGAEVRLPALPLIKPGIRLISAILLVICAMALYTLAFSDQFEVQTFQVAGLQRLSYADLEAVLKLEGSKIIEFNPEQAHEALRTAFPELGSIDIQVGLPAEVTIQVIERQPVFMWDKGDQVYWLDAEGVILPPRGEAEGLLRIESNVTPPLAISDSPQKGVVENPSSDSPTALWGQNVDTLLLKAINDLVFRLSSESNLVYNSIYGLGWQDPRGWEVYIGKNLENFEQKLTVYESIVEYFEKMGIHPQELVSVEFINAPFYK